MGRGASKSGPTVETIAKEANVSIATVSRVFNRKGMVRPELEKKILEIAELRGFTPRQANRRDTLVLVVEDIEEEAMSPYSAAIFRELIHACAERFYRLDILTPNELHMVRGRYVLGALGLLWNRKSIEAFEKIQFANLCAINSITSAPAVCSDEEQGMRLSLGYLIEKGHRKIGLITRDFETYGDVNRRRAFRDYLGSSLGKGISGMELTFDGSSNDLTVTLARAFRKERPTSGNHRPTAILATSEATGVQLMSCLDLLGIRVPDEVSILSHESVSLTEYLLPPHTSLKQDHRKLVETAIKIVTAASSVKKKPAMVPYQFIERDSVLELKA